MFTFINYYYRTLVRCTVIKIDIYVLVHSYVRTHMILGTLRDGTIIQIDKS